MGNSQSRNQAQPRLPPPAPLKTTPLEPSHISIHRDDEVNVQLSAPVSGTEAFEFRLPRNFLAAAIESLTVSDSRGSAPTIVFPSPPTTPAHFTAWQTLLANHVGSSVYVANESHAETIAGVHVPQPGDDTLEPLVFLSGKNGLRAFKLNDTQLFLSPGNSTEVCESLSALQTNDLPATQCVSVVVVAHGSETGRLDISYRTPWNQGCPFTFHYAVNGSDVVKRGEVEHDIPVSAHVVVFNPLPFDLKDIRVTLCDARHRTADDRNLAQYKRDWWRAERPRKKPEAENDGRSPAHDVGSASSSSSASSTYGDGESDYVESDDEEDRRENTCLAMTEPYEYKIPHPVSLRYMEALSVELPNHRASMYTGHALDISWGRNECKETHSFKCDVWRTTCVTNTSDMGMEAGTMVFGVHDGEMSTCSMQYAAPDSDIFFSTQNKVPFIQARSSISVREIGREVLHMRGNLLHYLVCSEWTIVVRLTNQRNDCGTQIAVGTPSNFTYLPPDKTAEVYSTDDFYAVPRGKGTPVSERDSFGNVQYWLPPGESKVLVIRCLEKKKRSLDVMWRCPVSAVEKLVRSPGTSNELQDVLRLVAAEQRAQSEARLEREMCEKRIGLLFDRLKRASGDPSGDDVDTAVEEDRRRFEQDIRTIREFEVRAAELNDIIAHKDTNLRSLRERVGELVHCSLANGCNDGN